VVSFTTRPLYPQGKSPWYPLDRKLGGGPIAVLDALVKRKIPSPRRESNPTTPIVHPVENILSFNVKIFYVLCSNVSTASLFFDYLLYIMLLCELLHEITMNGEHVRLSWQEVVAYFKAQFWHSPVTRPNNKLSLILTKHHAIETYWRGGGIAPRIL
jgi:hypothetical protein